MSCKTLQISPTTSPSASIPPATAGKSPRLGIRSLTNSMMVAFLYSFTSRSPSRFSFSASNGLLYSLMPVVARRAACAPEIAVGAKYGNDLNRK